MTAMRHDLGDGALLRALSHLDASEIHAACQDPDIVAWTRVPTPYTLDDAHDFVRLTTHPGEPATDFAVAVADPDLPDGRLVGTCGLVVDARTASGELGYWMAPEGRGQGLATRAAGAVCAYGFEKLGLARIWMTAAVGNTASNAIAARLGFSHEGVLRNGHRMRDAHGRELGHTDAHIHGLLPGELARP